MSSFKTLAGILYIHGPSSGTYFIRGRWRKHGSGTLPATPELNRLLSTVSRNTFSIIHTTADYQFLKSHSITFNRHQDHTSAHLIRQLQLCGHWHCIKNGCCGWSCWPSACSGWIQNNCAVVSEILCWIMCLTVVKLPNPCGCGKSSFFLFGLPKLCKIK